jgi:hypothetical protein
MWFVVVPAIVALILVGSFGNVAMGVSIIVVAVIAGLIQRRR